MYTNLLIWLLLKCFNGKGRSKIETLIKELYRVVASENLQIKSELIRVKKGKKRYDLLIWEMPCGKLKFDLGRHWETKTA